LTREPQKFKKEISSLESHQKFHTFISGNLAISSIGIALTPFIYHPLFGGEECIVSHET